MRPIRILGATRVLAKDQPEYLSLAIRDSEIILEGKKVPFMTSLWELSPFEMSQVSAGYAIGVSINGVDYCRYWHPDANDKSMLAYGGGVLLSIMGAVHPPVFVHTVESRISVHSLEKAIRKIGKYFVTIGFQPAPSLVESA